MARHLRFLLVMSTVATVQSEAISVCHRIRVQSVAKPACHCLRQNPLHHVAVHVGETEPCFSTLAESDRLTRFAPLSRGLFGDLVGWGCFFERREGLHL